MVEVFDKGFNGLPEKYECNVYPCIHVVVDYRRKRYAAFIETLDTGYYYIKASEILAAAEKINSLMKKHFREAVGDEIDEIAARELGAERIEFEEEEYIEE